MLEPMARPVFRKLEQDIADAGGLPYIERRVEAGETITAIATTFGISRAFLMFWLHRNEERWLQYQAARLRSPKWQRVSTNKRTFYRQILAHGGEDAVFHDLAEGKTIRWLCDTMRVRRQDLLRWFAAKPRRKMRYDELIRDSAGALADEALAIIDTADSSNSAAVQKAREQVNTRKWLAGVRDKKTYGTESTGQAAAIQIGALHLNALLKFGGPREGHVTVPALEGQIVTPDEIEMLPPSPE